MSQRVTINTIWNSRTKYVHMYLTGRDLRKTAPEKRVSFVNSLVLSCRSILSLIRTCNTCQHNYLRDVAEMAQPLAGPLLYELVELSQQIVYDSLGWTDVLEALDAHPRIGERASGADREASWSRGEQAAASRAATSVTDALVEANREYEQLFGHVFLICATGRSAEAILTNLRARLGNAPADERLVVLVELRKITHLRLHKLLGTQGNS